MWLKHTHACTHTLTHLISLMPKRQGGQCLTVVHEYAEHISTVLSKDRSTLKSSSSPVFFSLSFSPIASTWNSFYPSIYLQLPPSFLSFLLALWLELQINAQVPAEGAHSLFFPLFLFPIISNSLNLELPWQQEEQGLRGKRAPFPLRGSKARKRSGRWVY